MEELVIADLCYNCSQAVIGVFGAGKDMSNTESAWADFAGALFKSLGYEYRLKILHHLRAEPLTGDQLASRMGTTKGILTTHLIRLQRDNLIARQPAERGYIYSLSNDHALAIVDRLQELYG